MLCLVDFAMFTQNKTQIWAKVQDMYFWVFVLSLTIQVPHKQNKSLVLNFDESFV